MNIKEDYMGFMTVYGKVHNGTDHVTINIFPVYFFSIQEESQGQEMK